MKRLTISDANIFIDLLQLELVHFLFELEFEVLTTKEVFDELLTEQQQLLEPFIVAKKLTVHHFTSSAMAALKAYKINNRLSFSDHSVVFLAEKMTALVLTGDQLIRKACEARSLEVHGVLWLLEQFLEHGFFDKTTAHASLTRLMQVNKWLPRGACLERLRVWEG